MKFSNPYWTDKTRIELLEKWIIVHSILYYEMDASIISDFMFDNNCKQLVDLSEAHREDFIKSKWYYIFKDFDGSSGYFLYGGLKKNHKKELMQEALLAKKVFEEKGGKYGER